LESLIDSRYLNPALSNAVGTGQWTEGNAFSGVRAGIYWSSSSFVARPDYAWVVYLLGVGGVSAGDETGTYYSTPLRFVD